MIYPEGDSTDGFFYQHPDGQYVTERKLADWEIKQAEDQRDFGVVIDGGGSILNQKQPPPLTFDGERNMRDRSWHDKIMDLVRKHSLGFLFNPGGGQFTNQEKGVHIQIPAWDDQEDYEILLRGLQKLGLEPVTPNDVGWYDHC